MKNIFIILKKEIKQYFTTIQGYIIVSVFLIFSSFLYFNTYFLNNINSMSLYFNVIPLVFLFFIPSIATQTFSEENKTGTIELLKTWPLKNYEIILSKFLLILFFIILIIILSLPIVVTLISLGRVDLGIIVSNYFGLLFLGLTYSSIGIFISSLTKNYLSSFFISIVTFAILFFISEPFIIYLIPSKLANIFRYFGLSNHYYNFVIGIIDLKDIVYFLSLSFLFLFLAKQKINN